MPCSSKSLSGFVVYHVSINDVVRYDALLVSASIDLTTDLSIDLTIDITIDVSIDLTIDLTI